MSDEIFFDGVRYISASDAASSSDFTRDYIARLCRDGKIRGRRVGKNWYVDHASFRSFLVTQEYAKSLRNGSLAQERVREYHGSGAVALPRQEISVRPMRAISESARSAIGGAGGIVNKMAAAVAAHSSKTIAHTSRALNAPGGFAHAALSAHVPVYTLSPLMEFFHKVVALTLTFMLTFGTYAVVDPQFGRFAALSVKEELSAIRDSYHSFTGGGFNAFADRAQTQVAAAAENPAAAFASVQSVVTHGIPTIASQLARALNMNVNNLVYSIAFPLNLTRSRGIAGRNDAGLVAVEIVPIASNPSSPTTVIDSTSQTAGNQPVRTEPVERVIERVVERERLLVVGGITEEILNKRLAELDSRLSSRMLGSSAANSTQVTNVYTAAASVGRIEHLKDLDLETPTIRGGTITGTGVFATTLAVSGTATSTFGGGLDISDGCFAIDGTCISGSSGGSDPFTHPAAGVSATTSSLLVNSGTSTITNLVTVNATSTNATSTNFFATNASTTNSTSTNMYSSSLIAGNATSTNLFSTLGRFTTGIVDTLTSTLATITSLTATNLIATNATTTNATTTNLAISGLGQGWFFGEGTGAVRASTSPTVNYLVATSTSVASQFWGGFISFASTTLQNFTGQNATTSNATSTSLFATALRATNGSITSFLATSGTTTNATSTTFATTALCLTGDLPCRTTWPSTSNWTDGGAFLSPLTAGDGLLVNAASSTITNLVTVNATSTNATTTNLAVSGTTILQGLTSAIPVADAGGTISEYQGSTCTNQFVRSLNGAGVATCATVDLTLDVTGDLPFANLAQVAAASILGNQTSGTGDARSIATSTLFGAGTPGFVLTFIDGQSSWVATTTLANITGTLAVAKGGTGVGTFTSSELIYGNGTGNLSSVATGTVSGTNGITVTAGRAAVGGALAVDCTVASGSAAGCLASADWTTFNNKNGYSWPFPSDATSTRLSFTGGIVVNAASSTIVNLVTVNATSTNATTTNLAVSGTTILQGLTSAIPLADAGGTISEYQGSTCTNQFVRSLNGAGAATCATVSLTADVTGVLAVANGGTGWANINTGYIPFGNAGSALSTSSSLFFDSTGNRLGIGTTTPFSSLQSAASAAASTFRGQLTLSDTNAGVDQKHFTFTSVAGEFRLGSSTDAYATSTLFSLTNASTTFSKALFSSSAATSSFANGVNLTAGCWAIAGACIGGGGGSSNWTDGGAFLSPLTAGDGILVNAASSTITNLDTINSTSTNATSTRLYTSGQTILAATGGNVGIGTSTPFRRLSLTDTVSTAQAAIAYDTTRFTEMRVDTSGDFNIGVSGGDLYLNNENLWACTGGSITTNGCPSGSPTGQGNLIVENKLGIGTTTLGVSNANYKLAIETQDSTTNFLNIASSTANWSATANVFTIGANGRVGVGSSTPWARLSVGAGGAIVTTENSLTDAATITVSWLDGNQQKVILGGNRTINFTNYIAGQILRLVVCQDGTGSRTVTWDSAVIWNGHTAPTLTTTANQCDLATFVATGATSTLKIFGAAAQAF